MPFIRFVRPCRLVLCRFTPYEAGPPLPVEGPAAPPEGPLPNAAEGYDYSWVQDVPAGSIYEVGEFADGEEGTTCMEFLTFDAYADVPNAFWVWCESLRLSFDPTKEAQN